MRENGIIRFKPAFVQTKNVRNFDTLMAGLMLDKGGPGEGDERLACVYGQAGRGKTRTIQSWAARQGSVYLETVSVWSELDFLKALARELGSKMIPGRRGACFDVIIEAMLRDPRPLFIDEVERFGQRYLEICRDLVKITGGAIVLIGEEDLPHLMRRNRRVWSRTYREMEFAPVAAGDVVTYVNQTTGLALSGAAAQIMHQASGGDLRIVRRDTINLVHVVNTMGRQGEIDPETAKLACTRGLGGK